ncbi:2-hydroxyacyl-CoA dehydratase [Chloroflexota bacterium]
MEKKKQHTDRVANRLESVRGTRPIIDGYYEGIRQAAKKGELVGWHVGEAPRFVFEAAGIYFGGTGHWAAYLAARHANLPLLEAAESEGYPSDMCPYFKTLIGYSILMARNELDGNISEEYRLGGPPDFLFSRAPCSQAVQSLAAIQHYLKVPVFVMDTPFVYDEENADRYYDYVQHQTDDLIRFIEQLTGRPYPWHILQDKIRAIKKEHSLREEIWKLSQTFPLPVGMGDWFMILGPTNTQKGSSIEYLQRVKAEVEERVAHGVGTIPEEKIRLYWYEIIPWYRLGSLTETLARHNVVVVPGNYGLGDPRPEIWDTERPVLSCVREFYDHQTRHILYHRYEESYKKRALPFNVDGAIYGASRGCKEISKASYDVAEKFERETGIPTLVITPNHADPRDYTPSDAEELILKFVGSLKQRRRQTGQS